MRSPWKLICAAFTAAFAFGAHADVLDQRAFARAALERLQHSAPEAKFTLRAGENGAPVIEHAWPDGHSSKWFLDNAYQQYREDPRQLDAIVDQQLRSWRETRAALSGPARADAAAHLLPVIKTRAWFEATTAQLASMAPPDKVADALPLHRDLAGDLVLVFAEDDVEGMRFVSTGALQNLQLRDAAALERRALDNLGARLGELQIVGKEGRYRLEFDNFYEASFVLLEPRWRDRLTIDGDPVIAIAARNTVMVCGSRDRASIDVLRSRAADISNKAAYGLSAQLYTLHDGKLSVYAP